MINPNSLFAKEIVKRAEQLNITNNPDKPSHSLGTILDEEGQEITAHILHAVDAVITDGTHVIVIDRINDPRKDKPALPGGFIDTTSLGHIEDIKHAAAREALEEAGITLQRGRLIGVRRINRPFDIRRAYNAGLEKAYNIRKNDVFMVSTQAVRFDVPNLESTSLKAGDDAKKGSARMIALSSLNEDIMGIQDHFSLIREAVPEYFGK